MMDREALAAAVETLYPTNDEGRAVWDAARRWLAVLPETCGTCGGKGEQWFLQGGPHGVGNHGKCADCHGSGKVYPPETVDRIAQAMWIAPFHGEVDGAYVHRVALAVLDALNTVEVA